MLNAEGIAFSERLKSSAIGKDVLGGEIRAVPHAFDKKPNPVSFPESADKCYSEACAELKRVFGRDVSEEERRILDVEGGLEVERWEDEGRDRVGSLSGHGGPEIRVTEPGRERDRDGGGDGEGKGKRRRSLSNPGKAFKLENMI